MSNPVTDTLISWLPDASTTDLNAPQGGASMQPGGPTELAGELRRIKSEVRALSLNLGWERWQNQDGTLSYVGPTQFSLSGDQRSSNNGPVDLGRRIKYFVTGGTGYSFIKTIQFSGGVTTVTIGSASLNLDAGLSEVQFGLPYYTNTPSPKVELCRVTNSGSQNTSSNTPAYLNYDTVVEDPFGDFDIGSPDRITAAIGGKYLCFANVSWVANATGDRTMNIVYSGDGNPVVSQRTNGDASKPSRTAASTVINMAAGDYIRCQVNQTSGGVLAVENSANVSPILGLCRIS